MRNLKLSRWVSKSRRARMAQGVGLLAIAIVVGIFRASLKPSPTATELLRGERLLQRGRFDEAMTVLQTYVADNPQSAEGQFRLGRALRRAGSLGKSMNHLRRARELGWDEQAVDFQQQLAALQSGNVEVSIERLSIALPADDPRRAEAYEAATLFAIERQNLDGALQLTAHWLELEPQSIRAHLIRAYGHEVAQQWKLAADDYQFVRQQDPENVNARRSLGKMLLELNQPQAARREFEFCVAQDGDDPVAFAGLARAMQALSQADQAADLLENATRRHPSDPELHLLLGTVQKEQGQLEAAERSLQRAIDINPSHIEAHYQLSQVLVRAGAGERAREEAALVSELRKRRNRIRQIREQLATEPTNVAIRYEAARLLISSGADGEAVIWLQSVLTYDPYHREANRALAEHFEKLGNRVRALDHRSRAEGRASHR